MTSPWLVSALLLACAARSPAPQAAGDPDRAPLGLRIQRLEEGLLVGAIYPDTGAALAGLQPGDLVVEVDGVEVRRAPEAARHGLRGPAGTTVDLVVRAPLSGEYREVRVERGVGSLVAPAARRLPASVLDLRVALSRRGPAAARRAVREALADGFGGMAPAEAVGAYLRRAVDRRAATARAATEALSGTHPDDDALSFKLGEAWHGLGAWDRAAAELAASEAGRPPDTWDPGGEWRGDGGGNPRGRRMLAEALVELGDRDGATDVARALVATWDEPALRGRLGLAPLRQPEPWRAALPPIDEIALTTLDGSPWRLSEQRGRVVVVTFFATWCGPCRRELPELHALWVDRRDRGLEVLAVSIDSPDDAGQLPAFVEELGLPYPVAHAPALKERFAVSGIPALRVIDGEGALVYAARGYSRAGMSRLSRVVDEALDGAAGTGQALLGQAWTAGSAELVGFYGVPGARDLAVRDGNIAVGRDGGPPVVLAAEGGGAGLSATGAEGGELVAWLDGPVVAARGERWVRALTPGGRARWLVTSPDPVRALAASGELLWLATEHELVAVDALGRLVHRVPGGALGLAPAGDGGVWAVDGAVRRRVSPDGTEQTPVAARGAYTVDPSGRVTSQVFEDLVTGRFGPDGALRTVVVRTDGTIVGLDGAGRAAFTWELEDPSRLGLLDVDEDGHDELLVAVRRQGLATVALALP